MNIAILLHGLTYGGILSLVMFFFVFGSLYYNPEIWPNDFPADIREKYGFHFRGFLKGTLVSLVASLILTAINSLIYAGLGNL
jgi:hypothetical protein